MIESFNHKGLKRLYENNDRKLIRPDLVERVSVILAYLDAAKVIGELDLPTLRLHPLKGGLKGFWSITVAPTGALSFVSRTARRVTWN
jgi:toxin HigB-1